MPSQLSTAGDLLPLTHLGFHILLALSDTDLHGYAILKEVVALSDGAINPGTGTLYTAIQRLQGDGLITETKRPGRAPGHDERRRYYRLTPLGRSVLAAEAGRLEELVRRARRSQPGRKHSVARR